MADRMSHPPEPAGEPPGRLPGAEPLRATSLAADHPARTAAEHLFAELRDECSEVGLTARGMNRVGLEAGVRLYAQEARRLGASPEQTIILLKECLRDERLGSDRTEYDLVRESAVRWAIEAYFDAVASGEREAKSERASDE